MTRSHGSSPSLLQMITSGRIDNLLNEMDGVEIIPDTNVPSKEYQKERELKTYLDNQGYNHEEVECISKWWPSRSPVWDFICKANLNGVEGLILLEAKSHKDETKKARKPAPDLKNVVDFEQATMNHQRIEENINNEFSELGGVYTGYYQIANRVAFANKVRKVLNIPVLLVFLGFINDDDFKKNKWISKMDWDEDMMTYLRTLHLDGLLSTDIDELPEKIGIRTIAMPCHEDKRHVPQP